MKDVLKNTRNAFVANQKGLFAATLIISVMMIVAKFFGLLRLRVFATFFSPEELDIYLASFRIPDFIFETIFSGAIATAFIPIYLKYQDDDKKLSRVISSIINGVFLLVSILCVLLFIFMHPVIRLIVPGFTEVQVVQVVEYSRLLLIAQMPFFVAGYFLTGIGQAHKIFLPSSLAPVVYNVMVIIATVMFAHTYHILAPIGGVVIGALLFCAVQIPVLKQSHYKYMWGIPSRKGIYEFVSLVGPRVFTTIANQVDIFVDLSLATLAGSGMYTIFYLSQHLMLLPVTVIGYSYGQASLPYLFELYNAKKIEEFKTMIVKSILNVFYVSIPLAILIILLRTPVTRLVFGGREFDWAATNMTALTVSYFALSLPAHALYYFILRVFYAMHDAKTPFTVSAAMIALNSILSALFILVFHFPIWSLALSFTVTIGLNIIILLIILRKRLGGFKLSPILYTTIKINLSACIAGSVAYYTLRIVDGLIIDASTSLSVLYLLSIVSGVYILLYWYATWFFGLHHIDVASKIKKISRDYRRKMIEVTGQVE